MKWRIIEQILYNEGCKEKVTWRQLRQVKRWSKSGLKLASLTTHQWKGQGYNCSLLRNKGSDTHIRLHSPGNLTRKMSTHNMSLETSKAYIQKSQRLAENGNSTLKGHALNIIYFESQHRGSSLKSTCVTCEGDSLTNFTACVRRTGICWNVLWEEKPGRHIFFSLLFYLVGLALVGTISDILQLLC